jgi:hypothetical protein
VNKDKEMMKSRHGASFCQYHHHYYHHHFHHHYHHHFHHHKVTVNKDRGHDEVKIWGKLLFAAVLLGCPVMILHTATLYSTEIKVLTYVCAYGIYLYIDVIIIRMMIVNDDLFFAVLLGCSVMILYIASLYSIEIKV